MRLQVADNHPLLVDPGSAAGTDFIAPTGMVGYQARDPALVDRSQQKRNGQY
jgi:hypothetical protein